MERLTHFPALSHSLLVILFVCIADGCQNSVHVMPGQRTQSGQHVTASKDELSPVPTTAPLKSAQHALHTVSLQGTTASCPDAHSPALGAAQKKSLLAAQTSLTPDAKACNASLASAASKTNDNGAESAACGQMSSTTSASVAVVAGTNQQHKAIHTSVGAAAHSAVALSLHAVAPVKLSVLAKPQTGQQSDVGIVKPSQLQQTLQQPCISSAGSLDPPVSCSNPICADRSPSGLHAL